MLTLSSPVFAYLELTFLCNSRCPGCGNVFARDALRPPLSAAQWREVLLKLKPHIFRLRLTGGEPTLHPEFEDIVGFIHELDIPFAIFSNGRWLDPERLVTFLRSIPQFSGFLISLHGATPAAHDAFTDVKGSFEETVTNIGLAIEAGLSVNTSTIITKQNYADIADIVQLSVGLGAQHAVFNRYVGQELDGISPSNEELKKAMQAIDEERETGARVKFSVCIPQCFYPSSSTGCLAGIAYFTIDPWGNVRPCNHAPLICGNLLEQSVEEIWNSKAMEYWRDLIPFQCQQCLELPKCHGGCRAQAMLLGLDKDPLIGKPVLTKPQEPLEELVLYEEARPLSRFAMRPEPFGYVLVQGNRVAPVSHEAKAVLDVLDGQTTLRQIERRFGEQALSFVGSLYRQGLVTLE